MRLILTGGGSPDTVRPIDVYFSDSIDRGKPVLYIPVAMEAHVYTYEQCLDWFRTTYADYGITNVEMCTDLRSLRLSGQYAAVFIGGGNTFKLLHEIRQSGFAGQLKPYLQSGGTLYGGSAGAIICGKTIEPAACMDENHLGLRDLSALNLLQEHDVFCHYDPAVHDPFIRELKKPLYALYEASGLVLEGNAVRSVGEPFLTIDK